MALGVPILKHFRVTDPNAFMNITQPLIGYRQKFAIV